MTLVAFSYKMHTKAIDEYAHAYEWYENERHGLGEKFIDAVDRTVADICENPLYYGFVSGAYRQRQVEGFPYSIVYKFFPKRKLVYISSIFHTSRNPREKFRKEEK